MLKVPHSRADALEVILYCFTDKPRAAAMVGDLLEAGKNHSRGWLWNASARLLFRFMLGSIALSFVGMLGYFLWMLAETKLHHLTPPIGGGPGPGENNAFFFWLQDRHEAIWMLIDRSRAAIFIANLLGLLPLLIRFGVRNRIAQVAIVLVSPLLVSTSQTFPYFGHFTETWIVGTLLAMLVFRPTRKSAAIVAISSLLSGAIFGAGAQFHTALTPSWLTPAIGTVISLFGIAAFAQLASLLDNLLPSHSVSVPSIATPPTPILD